VPVHDDVLAERARRALHAATDLLLARQDPSGYWKGEFDTGLIGDASDVILRRFLGHGPDSELRAAAATLRGEQLPDGGWAAYHGGPSDLVLSVLAYVALRLAGGEADDPDLRRAAGRVRELGGIEAVDNPAIMAWLCLLGLWPWEDVPLVPPELVLLPTWFPGNVYQIGAAARGIVVANSLFMSRRPVRPVGFTLDELWAGPVGRLRRRPALRLAARVTHWYARHPLRWLRRRALAAGERWLVAAQERDGSWGGNWLQTADTVVGLEAVGYPRDHPVIAAAIGALDRCVIDSGGRRKVEMWTAVVMDTALAVTATAGQDRADARAAAGRGAAWLVERQVLRPGDWAVLTPDPVPGAWPYEFVNDRNPDADDTSWVVTALSRLPGPPAPEVTAACDRAVRWLLSQQGADGGWAAFEPLRWRLPGTAALARMGFLEPHSADITGHVLEALAARGLGRHPAARRGVAWLLRHQHPDGSWPGWWACYHLHGTSAAVTGLTACGLGPDHPAVRRAADWLERHQQPDGGWGEDIRALHDPAFRGRGTSTPSQTSWALLALAAAGRAGGAAAARGVDFLARTQLPDGDWAEPQHTWVVHHEGLYWRDTLLRLVYPVTALAAVLQATDQTDPTDPTDPAGPAGTATAGPAAADGAAAPARPPAAR
jgi:squalene-hopene/tetraprenyl-beta-curcumene cyclase